MKKTIFFIMIVVTVGVSSCVQSNDSKVSTSTNSISNSAVAVGDTTIYDLPTNTAELVDAITYFRQNNKFKDWDKNDSKLVVLQGVVEKDGTINSVKIMRSSNEKELDDEALRLIKSAKYSPRKNSTGEDVRSKLTIVVEFPAK